MRNAKNRKIVISILTVLMMIFTLMPGMAFADGGQDLVDYTGLQQGKTSTRIYMLNSGTMEDDFPTVFGDAKELYSVRWKVKTNQSVTEYFDNYIMDRPDSRSEIEFVFSIGGSGMNNDIYDKTAKDFKPGYVEGVTKFVNIVDLDGNRYNRDVKLVFTPHQGSGGGTGGGPSRAVDAIVKIAPNELDANETYRLAITSGLSSARAGQELDKDIYFTFTTAPILVDSINLDKTSTTIYHGATTDINATVTPENATDKTLVWTSSNEKVATVKDGKVTAVGVGTATIKVTSKDGNASAECKVTVKPISVTKVKVSAKKATLTVGRSKTLKAYVYPSNATNKAVTWKSSNKKIAKVSSTGKVKAVKPGKATVTVTSKDGSLKAKTVIKVIPKNTSFNLSAKTHSITIKYKKISGVSGYEIYRASSKGGKYKKVTTRSQKKQGTYTSIMLRSDKTYYYKIRTYKSVGGNKIYSNYSSVKKIRTK